jgi:predicted AAA+ superfamily ATPase
MDECTIQIGRHFNSIWTTPETWVFSHFRNKDQVEVDFVLESSMREIIGIEVKAAASVQATVLWVSP